MTDSIRARLELPASHRFLNVVGGCITEFMSRVEDFDDREMATYQLQLAAQEISTNIVNHAYENVNDGRFEVLFEIDERAKRFVLTFYDSGAPFAGIQTPVMSISEPSEGGMGLFLIRQLVDQFDYERQGQRNIWTISKSLA